MEVEGYGVYAKSIDGINGFRYGFLGTSDVPLLVSFGVLAAFALLFFAIAWYLIRTGLGLRQ